LNFFEKLESETFRKVIYVPKNDLKLQAMFLARNFSDSQEENMNEKILQP
jgi:hypothetical protein